ncbi:MAG TPA: serine/threonine-protein kinase [Solirubrobacteraceae bacterium]|nr:serine/threonine-protein kinase [Solirubrobacteraceae bacterium]
MLGQGDRIAGYEVEAVIARGGMGVVYRAHQVGLGRSVALKVIAADRAADPMFRARFVREAQLAASLDHPNVIPVFEAGDDDGELFIAMRLVDGSDLQRLIERSGPLDAALACRIVARAAAGLEAAHRLGLVHRDVKPANILLAGPARDPHVYVSDFGVAKSSSAADGAPLTHVSEWVGTPGYAAPEQVRGGEVDARADVYALGCVLLAAVTRPASGPRPPLPAAVQAVIDRATAAAPSARFQSARALAGALERVDAGGLAGMPAADQATTPNGSTATTAPRLVATLPAGGRRSRASADGGPDGGGPAGAAAARAPAAAGGSGGGDGGDRSRRWSAVGFAVGFVVIVAGVLAVALTRGGGGRAPRPAVRAPARTVPVVVTPSAEGGGDTVFCNASSCTQSGQTVLVPIEGGSCIRDAVVGTWTRLDAGAPEPMLICLPQASLPRSTVGVRVPTLTGGRLDHVESALDRLGIPYRTSGGGLFGIISSSDWTVCATSPTAGGRLLPAAQITVFVEHSC